MHGNIKTREALTFGSGSKLLAAAELGESAYSVF